jgi:Co/Zn/Cd efflux system component
MGMEANKDKVTIIAGHSGIIVEAGQKKRALVGRKLFMIGVGIVAVAAVVVVVLLFANHHKKQEAATKRQNQLQKTVTNVDAYSDISKLHGDSNALIQGAQNGTYKVSNKQLAQAYAARGDAEFNSADEKSAVADYEQAVKLDASLQALVGYNEFVARYHQGERQTLIPFLQELQKPYQNNHDTGAPEQYAQYQGYIDNLQAGKELGI